MKMAQTVGQVLSDLVEAYLRQFTDACLQVTLQAAEGVVLSTQYAGRPYVGNVGLKLERNYKGPIAFNALVDIIYRCV